MARSSLDGNGESVLGATSAKRSKLRGGRTGLAHSGTKNYFSTEIKYLLHVYARLCNVRGYLETSECF